MTLQSYISHFLSFKNPIYLSNKVLPWGLSPKTDGILWYVMKLSPTHFINLVDLSSCMDVFPFVQELVQI
jgi:hypothetical protein